jgi:uncharacterized protein YciI
MNYKQPHYVMLVFDRGARYHQNKAALAARTRYYSDLRDEGKVLLQGSLLSFDGMVTIVRVSSDSDLEEIINNDPALEARALEIIEAIPFKSGVYK